MNITHRSAYERFYSVCEWSRLAKASKIALIGFAAAALALPTFGQEAEEDEEDPEAKRVTVTGSRIKRLDVETPNPVVVITREDFEATGFSTVGDALRALPYNTGQSLVAEDSGTSFTPGVSSINLRGLGNNNTLVLINDRRSAPFGASGFNGFQTVFDFNSVPASAIDSIEILKDGASAIYGSDAVAGVINIKLRKDFEGMNASVSIGNTEDTDSTEKSLFFMMGTSTAKTQITTTFDYVQRNGIQTSDLTWAANRIDLREDKSSGGFFNPFPAGHPNEGRFDIDWRSSRSFPARFTLPVDANGLAAGTTVTFPGISNDPQDVGTIIPITRNNPDAQGNSPGYYNYAGAQEGNATNLFPNNEFWGFYTSASHEMYDWLTLNAELSFRRANIFNNSAPAPLTSQDENGDAAGGGIQIPADNPFNPLDVPITQFAWRMHSSGPRINDITADYPRVVLELAGDIGFTWSWTAGLMWAQSSYTNRNPGVVFDDKLQEALNGVVLDGRLMYANPFGYEDRLVTDFYTGENPNTTRWDVITYDFQASGELFDMPAGPAGLAVGIEYRDEEFEDIRTLNNETGNLVGGSEGFGFSGADRKVFGAFAEINLPIHRMLELQAAARFEDYSDFGNTTKPKVAGKFRPFDWLLVRASWGQSFKAPDLPFLYSPGSVSFTSSPVIDPKRPNDTATQLKTVGAGNPDLGPEETDVYYAGIQWEPGDELFNGLFEGLTLGVDYFQFFQENLITRVDPETVLANEDTPNYPGGSVQRNELQPGDVDPVTGEPYTVGTLFSVTNSWFNAPEFKYEGLDYAATYVWDTENWGNFRVQAVATQLFTFSGQDATSVDQVGLYNVPEWRGSGTFAWTRGDWAASVFTNYVSGYEDDFGQFLPDVESYWRTNLQVAYRGFYDTTITLGVRNGFDQDPPVDYSQAGSYAVGVHNPEPRFWYLRMSRDW